MSSVQLILANGWTVSITAVGVARLAAWPTSKDGSTRSVPAVSDKKNWFRFQKGLAYDGEHQVQVGGIENLVELLEEVAAANSPIAAPSRSNSPVQPSSSSASASAPEKPEDRKGFRLRGR